MKVRIWLTFLFIGFSIITVTSLPSSKLPTTSLTTNSSNTTISTTLSSSSVTLPPSLSSLLKSSSTVSLIDKRKRAVPPEYSMNTTALARCDRFINGDPEIKRIYNPNYPNDYQNNTDCVNVLEAPVGFLIRLDFRDKFHIEPSEGCNFDYLEIRDGPKGFSKELGKFCGTDFPNMILSSGRHLWLRFHSDDSIEYSGFVAVYEYVERPTSSNPEKTDCRIDVAGSAGIINRTEIESKHEEYAREQHVPLDCMWRIQVAEGWKILLTFLSFKLVKPNECEQNFVQIFGEFTDMTSIIKNFCGSMADSASQKPDKGAKAEKGNIMHVRFFATPVAINSSFSILFTAIREKALSTDSCTDDEYDCEDQTCIAANLRCNKFDNCRFRYDEENCDNVNASYSEHVIIIIIVFGLILGGMLATFLINCLKKLIRDQKIIREHIRQSKESKLDELGRHSTKLPEDRISMKRSPENLSAIKLSPRGKDSSSTVHILDDMPNRYYREVIPITTTSGTRIDIKKEHNTRNQEPSLQIKDILESNYNRYDENEGQQNGSESGMCDMACQTRESLFQPIFKNKVTQSPIPPSEIRFSTFGYDSSSQKSVGGSAGNEEKPRNVATTTIRLEDLSQPHQHQHHHHHHHHQHHQHHQTPQQQQQHQQQQQQQQQDVAKLEESKKFYKNDESRSYGDIRKSAPDVIIMTSH